ncbi:MAG: T9SS type A sorting domain-containing protein [Bacteroidota bacterium]
MRKIITTLLIIITSFNSYGQWTTVPNAPTDQRFDDVTFINDSVGFIAQGFHLFKTIDAGETWSQISTLPLFSGGGYVRSIEFINDTVGFYGTLPSTSVPGRLYRTSDGGLTFIQCNIISAGDGGVCGIAHFGNTIIGGGAFMSSVARFYKSVDAGLNWTSTDMSALMGGFVDCYMFDYNNYLISGISTQATGNRAIILRTSDGGTTWTQVAVCSIAGLSFTWKMFFLPGTGHGFASVEGNPVIFKTVDYGNTWTEINLGISSATELGAIGALNDTVIWVGSQWFPGMYGTQDGGTTWTAYPAFGENMDRMVMLDPQHLLCVGSTIYKYSDSSVDVPVNPAFLSKHHFVTIHPNPVESDLTIKMQLFQSSYVLLDVIDMNGNYVMRLFSGAMDEGKQEKQFSLKDISKGAYTLLFRSNEEFIPIKLVKD